MPARTAWSLALIAWIAGAAWLSGCEDDGRDLYLGVSFPPGAGEDAGDDTDAAPDAADDASDPLAPASVCTPNQVACLATAAPEILRCEAVEGADDLYRWRQTRCPEGEVCQGDRCGAFACEPHRGACLGLGTRGVCSPEGDALLEQEPCPEGSACRGGLCVSACEAAAANRSYIGCDYLVAELPNPLKDSLAQGSPFGLVVANTDPLLTARLELLEPEGTPAQLQGEVLVFGPDLSGAPQETRVRSEVRLADGRRTTLTGEARAIELPPGAVATLLPQPRALPGGVSGRFAAARRLRSTQPVVAYQFNPYCCDITYTNDATILLPTTALGNQYTYVGPPDLGELSHYIAVSTPAEAVTLTLTLPRGSALRGDPTGALELPTSRLQAPQEVTVPLRQGEVLVLSSSSLGDAPSALSGAHLRADGPLAVFSGHECTYIPWDKAACDHLEQQLIPEDTWGRAYIAAMLKPRGRLASEVVTWHLVAGAQPVQVKLRQVLGSLRPTGAVAPSATGCGTYVNASGDGFALPAYAHCMIGSAQPFAMDGDAPFMVLGYLAGQDAAGTGNALPAGDPAMFLLPPVEQFRQEYTFLTPESYDYNYITLMIPLNGISTLSLDGAPFVLDLLSAELVEVYGSTHRVIHVPVTPGVHHIQASVPFGLIVYAYDRYVSYAYPGGLNLTKRK